MIIFDIKKIRQNKKISIRALGAMTNLSRTYLSDLENNKCSNPTVKMLEKIANALDVNIKDLFYTTFDIKQLKQEMYKRIDEFGINSEEVLEVSQLIDLLLNIDGIIKKKDEDTEKK